MLHYVMFSKAPPNMECLNHSLYRGNNQVGVQLMMVLVYAKIHMFVGYYSCLFQIKTSFLKPLHEVSMETKTP